MTTQFYDIKTKTIVEMEWEEIQKEIPIGYIPYPFASNSGKVFFPKNEQIYFDTEAKI